MSKFKIGNNVRLIHNYAGSVNKIGDSGKVMDIHEGGFSWNTGENKILTCNYLYKVFVPGRMNSCNISYEFDLCHDIIKIDESTTII